MSSMGCKAALLVFALVAPLAAHATSAACGSEVLSATPVRPTLVLPLAIELAPASTQLGGTNGMLTQAFDEALSVDNVLLRIRMDGCRATANAAAPASVVDPNDPAAYKPKTEFDNTPWRFNMTQNGKRMTADEFDAWMKSRGVRVVGRKDPAPVVAETGEPAVAAPAETAAPAN